MDSLVPILIIAVLILLNGLFVAAEFAIIGAPRVSLERRAASGDRVARLASRIQSDPRQQDRFVATAQLGITGASLGLGMYGEHLLAEWLAGQLEALGAGRWIAAHTLASILAITILTYFHIVIGEMVPKALALQHAVRTAVWVTPPMRALQVALYPLVVALNGIANGLLRLIGIDRNVASTEQYRTPEEIEFIVRESQAGGLLRKESAEVMQELMDFGELDAGEIMVPRVRIIALRMGSTAGEIRESLQISPHTRYPVYEETLDGIVGMVHIKDLLRLLDDDLPLGPPAVRPVSFVPETASAEQVLAAMRENRSLLVIVMDEHGGTAGIVTVEDLFEEVVGEIDEGPGAVPDIYEDAGGTTHVAGTVRVEEIGEHLGVVLEHEEVDTVSGLVLALLGRPPEIGDVIEYEDVRFEVTAIEGHGVRESVVALVEREEDADVPPPPTQ